MAVITDSIAERTPDAGVTVDGLLIRNGTLPDVPGAALTADQATALAAYQAALAAAENGQVLTATGPDEAAFADPAGGGASLSDYSNVIVVDAGGNGDYTSLAAAVTAAAAGDTIYIFGLVAEAGVSINKNLTIYAHPQGSTVTVNVPLTVTTGSVFLIGGKYSSVTVTGGTLYLRNATVDVVNLTGGILDSAGDVISDFTSTGTRTVRVTGTRFNDISVEGLSAASYFQACRFTGENIDVSAANAPFFSCSFVNLPIITVATGNYSNVVAGVTWPTIP